MNRNNQQGTGRHSHKSSEEPYHHTRENQSGSSQHASGSRKDDSGMHASDSSGGGSDMRSREYKDAQGNVHHHTKTYERQHGKK